MNSSETTQNMQNVREMALIHKDSLIGRINELSAAQDELRRELNKVNAFLLTWEQFSTGKIKPGEVADSISAAVGVSGRIQAVLAPLSSPKSVPSPKNSKKEDVAYAARKVIEDAGKPIMREDLFPALIEKGLIIEGSDPLMVLSTMLWRMKEVIALVRLRGGGYWLADKPWPPAGYDPVPDANMQNNSGQFMDTHDAIGDHGNTPIDHSPTEVSEDGDDLLI